MKIILLSGGSGKRLWPLSSQSRSKQFLQVIKNDAGQRISMVQATMEHLKRLGLEKDVIVAATGKQIEQLHAQLGTHIQTVIEPERKDTYPAILLCAAYLRAELNVDADETVIVLPVDHLTDASFYSMLFQLDKLIQRDQAAIGLIGVRPTEPSGKFGYMIPAAASGAAADAGVTADVHPIDSFIEKPDKLAAEALIAKGALWNCGVFALRLSYMLELIHELELEADYEWMRSHYHLLPSISFDYAVVENESGLISLVYEGRWSDLGTWDALSQAMEEPVYGRGLMAPDCHGTHIMNELRQPVLVSGIDHAVVVAGREGILVTAKKNANGLRPLIEQLHDSAAEPLWGRESGLTSAELPLENSFGSARTVDRLDRDGEPAAITRRVHILSGGVICCKDPASVTIWIILAGEGVYRAGDEDMEIRQGCTVKPSFNCSYEAAAATDMLEVILPAAI